MDEFNKLDTDEEIRSEILKEINKRNGNVRPAVINNKCKSETQFLRVMNEMIESGSVNYNGTFLFL